LDQEKLLAVSGHPKDVEIVRSDKPPFLLIFRQERRR